MKYEIKISKAKEENGKISLKRLEHIISGLLKIAEGALQIRLGNLSVTQGRKTQQMEDAIEIQLASIKKGSTVLVLEAKQFSETLSGTQFDLFRKESNESLGEETPVSLFIKTVRDATTEGSSTELLDKPLLKELKKLKQAFTGEDEYFTISNEGSIEKLKIGKEDFKKIKNLEAETPNPQSMILNGTCEVLSYSKKHVRIITGDGAVDAYLNEDLEPEGIKDYWGKEVTLTGKAHFRPGGKMAFFVIERIFKPGKGDKYFSTKPKSENAEQEIQSQLKAGKKANSIDDIAGKWPGNETDEEIEALLNEID